MKKPRGRQRGPHNEIDRGTVNFKSITYIERESERASNPETLKP
jgi:hypothetical protein